MNKLPSKDTVARLNEIKYDTGADFFRDVINHHGMEEAFIIGGRYLSAQLKTQLDDEKQFCRELFEAMQERSAGKFDPEMMVYPYDFAKANERLETRYYHDSRTANNECAVIIDTAINKSCYERNYYNLDMAAMVAVHDYGFNRVQAVLANQIQSHPSDGRYSRANKEWAAGFELPKRAFESARMSSHPVLIDGFANRFRDLYRELNAERFAAPGIPEGGSQVQGYWINRSVWFDDNRGFVVGHNPKAVSPFVCWQFSTMDGKREFYWGAYSDTEKAALDNLTARVIVHTKGEPVKEIQNPLASAEMRLEQNFNMIDGAVNNERARLDLTDGQTHEEVAELAPHTLPPEKPSVMEQIREAKKAPKPPRKKKDARGKDALEM
jgi:hypothetical protein